MRSTSNASHRQRCTFQNLRTAAECVAGARILGRGARKDYRIKKQEPGAPATGRRLEGEGVDQLTQVTIAGDQLSIERFVIQSAELCRYFEGFPDTERTDRLIDALKLGVDVLEKARARSEV